MQLRAKSPLAVTSVRPMRTDEAAEVCDLFRQVLLPLAYYNEQAKACELAKYTPDNLHKAIASDEEAVLVAEEGSRIAGYCISERNDGLIWLAWFGVAPDFRGKGVGTALLEALDQRTARSGSHKVWCDCRTSNTESKTVLLAHGFLPLCTARNHWHGQDFILWEKFIG